MKEKGFTVKKKKKKGKSWWYPTETITNADCADYLVLFENITAKVEYKLQSFEQSARGIGLLMNPDKIESICFNPGV